MLEGETRFIIYKTNYRGRTYDKCLINIPSSLVKNPRFPFKSKDNLKIFVDPDRKTMFLVPSWAEKEILDIAKETQRIYEEGLKSIVSDSSLTPLQRDVAKLYYTRTFKEEFPQFLSRIFKNAIKYAKSK
jgi:hypothetical protein